ncbi:MAG: GlsB/YeaQ/YmgE family stress response membrane protein [Saprospiraceae bacterium]|nr:GlsB/YeaQ/YmgE family stress response membrane protein [Saprospiraceae bacterium]MCB9345290.1 GlsB/YeaQ/YmgE family stress response membrane protein [Lewinellaceae bacterium]
MDLNELIFIVLVGAVSGWLAGQIRQGYGYGFFGNVIVGIIGAFVGSWLLRSVLHISLGGGLLGTILTSVIGALVVLFLIGLVKKS